MLKIAMKFPTDIAPLLKEVFQESSAYGQFATVDSDGAPWVRTVHLIADQELENIYINTHTASQKWMHISSGNQHVSACYWSQEKRIQFRFSAKASLFSHPEKNPQKPIVNMWNNMRPGVRAAYILADKNIPLYTRHIDINTAPHSPSHGIIVCDPYQWDVFFEDPDEYRFGTRSIFTRNKENTWQKKDVSSLHEKEILLYDDKL